MTFAINDVVRMTVTGTAPQVSVWQNVTHWQMTLGTVVTDSDLMDTAKIAYDTAFAIIDSNLNLGYSADLLTFWKRDKVGQVWNGIGTRVLTGNVGLSANDAVVHGVAFVGFLQTALLRRGGRTFLPGLIENLEDDGLWNAGSLVTFLAYLAVYYATLTPVGGTFTPCTYNTEAGSPHEETSSLGAGVVSTTNIPGYQRRRKPLVGI